MKNFATEKLLWRETTTRLNISYCNTGSKRGLAAAFEKILVKDTCGKRAGESCERPQKALAEPHKRKAKSWVNTPAQSTTTRKDWNRDC